MAGAAGRAARGRLGAGGREVTKAIARRFFDFIRDVPNGIIPFETISGRGDGASGDQYFKYLAHARLRK